LHQLEAPVRSIEGTSTSSPNGVAKPKGSMRWPIIVIALLAIHFTLMLTAAAIATRDRSFAVLPNYYENAINWDKSRAQQRASDQLGWKLSIEPSTTINPLGERAVKFVLSDASGKPIENAQLSMTYYHHAHAAEPKDVKLSESSAGEFVAKLPMRYAGIWQFDVTVEAQGHTFISNVEQYVNNEGLAK
jgi:nitrogen fixation protein FixH